MFKIGDRIIKINAPSGYEDTIGDIGVVTRHFGRGLVAEIVEGSSRFVGVTDYYMTQFDHWTLLSVELENK